MKFKEAYKWKPSATQRRAFAQRMQDPSEQAAYEKRKQDKADKRRAGSKFDYGTAGGYYVPTKAQYDFATNNMHLAKTIEEKSAFNDVIYGYGANEKVHHDSIHVVNEKMRSQTETYMKKLTESGSRRDKIIGRTSSGKPIYDTFKHPSHKDFTKDDHDDASELHAIKLSTLKRSDFKNDADFNYAKMIHKNYSEDHGAMADGDHDLKNELNEDRLTSNATYEQLKDKTIAKLSAQQGSAFTAMVKNILSVDSAIEKLKIEKDKISAELSSKVDLKDASLNALREKVPTIFNDCEKTNTLVVQTLNASMTLAKMGDSNLPSTKTTATTDFKKVVDLLLEQLPDLRSQIENLTKQCTTINTIDVPGKLRALRIDANECVLNEGMFDKLINWFHTMRSKFLQIFDRSTARQKKINAMINSMGQTSESKITIREFKSILKNIISEEISKIKK